MNVENGVPILDPKEDVDQSLNSSNQSIYIIKTESGVDTDSDTETKDLEWSSQFINERKKKKKYNTRGLKVDNKDFKGFKEIVGKIQSKKKQKRFKENAPKTNLSNQHKNQGIVKFY